MTPLTHWEWRDSEAFDDLTVRIGSFRGDEFNFNNVVALYFVYVSVDKRLRFK